MYPYFKSALKKFLYYHFLLSHDESMNRILQEEQMDILICYWNESLSVIETCYHRNL